MLLIKNATVYTMEDEGVIENCDILSGDGKIVAVGKDAGDSVSADLIIEATGLHVLPGIVDSHSHAGGLFIRGPANSDVNESSNPVTPHLNVIYGINILEEEFKSNPRAGVTTICIAPGSGNVIGGQCFATKTFGTSIYDMAIRNPCAMKCAMGGSPKGHGRRGGEPKTRMGVVAMLENELIKSREYLNKKETAIAEGKDIPKFDEKAEAFIPVLKKEIPIKVHCEQFDMVTVIRIAKKYDILYTIDHGWSSNLYIDELVAGGGPVLFGPIGVADSYCEASGGDIALVKEMDDRGIDVSIMTDCPVYTPDLMIISAGEAVRCGVSHERVLRMITVNPARAIGVYDRVGSIKPGKDADFAIFEGIPAIDMAANVRYTIVDGQIAHTG